MLLSRTKSAHYFYFTVFFQFALMVVMQKWTGLC